MKINFWQISQRANPSYRNKKEFINRVDSLPSVVEWELEEFTLVGDLNDEDGKPRTETLELWYRNPVDCIRELIGNPLFKNLMRYAPEQVFKDSHATSEVRSEMWTGEWWWEIQVSSRWSLS